MFDFDWTSSSHIKHSLDPGAIANWSVWTGGDPHLSLPSPIIHLTPSGDNYSSDSEWRQIRDSEVSSHRSVSPHPGPQGQSQGHQSLSNDQCQHRQCQTQCRMLYNAFWVMLGPCRHNQKGFYGGLSWTDLKLSPSRKWDVLWFMSLCLSWTE